MTADTAVVGKVRKLLAKAEATDNANEAEAFSAKAAALIAAHRIDAARLAAATGMRDELALRRVPLGRGAYVRARIALLQAIVEAHDATLVWESRPHGAVGVVAGFVGDLDAIGVLYESLHLQAAARMARIRRSTAASTQRWRRSFLFGFAARTSELLGEARREAEHGAAAGGRSAVPDRLSRAQQVRAYADREFGRVVAASAPRPAARDGWIDGHRAASSVDLGRPRVVGRRAIGPGAS
jgi:hypothetical protein